MAADRATILSEGSAALDRLAAGAAADLPLLSAAAAAMAELRDMQDEAGQADAAAGAGADHARLLHMAAEIDAGPGAGFTFARALAAAEAAQAAAVAAAESGGITKENLSAYVLATRIAGSCLLSLGEGDAGPAGRDRLAAAAAAFGEAAAGYRRLGRSGDAEWAELKALEARGRAALHGG